MLVTVLHYLRNYFEHSRIDGNFEIVNNELVTDKIADGQYYKVTGSIFNDGIYKYGSKECATDESFSGTVFGLAIPHEVLSLAEEIGEWLDQYGSAESSPYASESFGGYSYSLKSGNGNDNDSTGWKGVFGSRLNRWKKP